MIRRALIVLLCLAAASLASCGTKGDPVPPRPADEQPER
jgi:predicted small lipoprotein YifL